MNFAVGVPQACPSDTPLVILGTSSALASGAALNAAAVMAAAMNGAFMFRTPSADTLAWDITLLVPNP
jgi:hypothetical protein